MIVASFMLKTKKKKHKAIIYGNKHLRKTKSNWLEMFSKLIIDGQFGQKKNNQKKFEKKINSCEHLILHKNASPKQ